MGIGIGGGTSATSSGSPGGASGFNIDVRDTRANIVAMVAPATGVIAFVTTGVNQYDLMVYDGTNWQIYENS